MSARITGEVEDGFGAVADALLAVVESDGGAGASFAVYRDGQLAASVAAGTMRASGAGFAQPFTTESLVRVASSSKGAVATLLGVLIDDGAFQADDPVTRYWPEYGGRGKGETTIAQVASHRAGIPFADPEEGLEAAGLIGVDYFASESLLRVLERQAPLWEPGTAMAYHGATAGAVLDEVVRRATGEGIAAQFDRRVRMPLGLRAWFEVSRALVSKVARPEVDLSAIVHVEEDPADGWYARYRRGALAASAPIEPDFDDIDQVMQYYTRCIPAGGLVTDAVSLARMYAATLTQVGGVRLMSDETVNDLVRTRLSGVEKLAESGDTAPDLDFGMGYQLPSDVMPSLTPSSFGHTGAGGRLGLADIETGVSLAFVCTRMRLQPGRDPRWEPLLGAVADAIGV